MAKRIYNLNFFANLVNGIRRPVATNEEPEEIPAENPDPGGDGGGSQNPGGEIPTDDGNGSIDQGTGGDIGNPTGTAIITTHLAPVISRKSHQKDIFVPRGSTMSITYTIPVDGFMQAKGGPASLTQTYSPDGRELTLTWVCPADASGDSTYIGVECWTYGNDLVESYTLLYDRLHIAKTSADIVWGGYGTQNPIIKNAVDNLLTAAGRTVIIANGLYTNDRDVIHVGFDNFTQSNAASVANGVATQYQDTDFKGDTFTNYRIQKYSCVMAEDPGGVTIDRDGKNTAISLYGNSSYPGNRTLNGGRSVLGFHIAGFNVDDAAYTFCGMNKTYRTKFSYIFAKQDLVMPNPRGNQTWTGDGAIFYATDNVSAIFENCGVIGNERLLNNNGRQATSIVWRGVLATSGAVQLRNDKACQVFVAYQGHDVSWINCYNLDSADFAAATVPHQGGEVDRNVAFVGTNGDNTNLRTWGCLSLRDSRIGWYSDESGRRTNTPDILENTVFWDKINIPGRSKEGPMIQGGLFRINGVTVGKNQTPYSQLRFSAICNYRNSTLNFNDNRILNLLAVSPRWNYPVNGDTIVDLPAQVSIIDKIGVIADYSPTDSAISRIARYYSARVANASSEGLRYISRREPGSKIDIEGLGARNIFILKGEYGSYRDEAAANTIFDGTNGNPYVNAISRSPWQLMRASRRRYACTSNGISVSGNSGWAQGYIHPVDYINRQGVTSDKPLNTPFIEDIAGYLKGSSAVLTWRPVCVAYRSTITAYDIYVDGIRVAQNVSKRATSYEIAGLNSGRRLFNIVVKDSVTGDSGMSRTIPIEIP